MSERRTAAVLAVLVGVVAGGVAVWRRSRASKPLVRRGTFPNGIE